MAQLNTNYNPSLNGNPVMNDALFFETFVNTQESDDSTKMVHHNDELKCNMAMIFNLKKNLESLKNALLQMSPKDDQFHIQKQCSNELKVQMEYLLDEMKNYKLHLPHQKKSVPHHTKKKRKKRNFKKLECTQIKSFVNPKTAKKKPILKYDVENLCKSNGIQLSEVISRRNEAQKFLNFIQDMSQLRKVKVANAKVEGRAYSEETNAVIEKIINGIKDQWTKLMDDYNMEERNLKEMIKDDNSNNLSHSARLHYWERILFGDDICRTSYDNLDENSKKYYALRRFMWDESVDATEGVNVPLGWVMPQEPTHPAWKEYCQTD